MTAAGSEAAAPVLLTNMKAAAQLTRNTARAILPANLAMSAASTEKLSLNSTTV